MDNQFISVIVPIYNTEKYLRKCIESILEQSFQYFELILVDDGSRDTSGDICDDYKKRDQRIKVLHIANSGIFQARKAGVAIAEGEYLTFLDSDDWIDQGAFEFATEILNRDPEMDLLSYAYRINDREQFHLYEEGIYDREMICKSILKGMMFDVGIGTRRLDPSLCTKFLRKSLFCEVVKDVKDYITLGEDALVTYPCVCRAKTIGIFNKVYYNYRINRESITHTYPLERVIQIRDFQKNMINQMNEAGVLSLMGEQIAMYVRTFLRELVKNWFGMNLSLMPYIFPIDGMPQGASVIIYGAGSVGKSYVRELMFNRYVNITAWMDKNYEKVGICNGMTIISPDKIEKLEYDFVVIAVIDEDVAMCIKDDLIKKYNVGEDKIYWKKPIFAGQV